jgi:hypothetical protein
MCSKRRMGWGRDGRSEWTHGRVDQWLRATVTKASLPTPTTRILAIGTIQPGADLQQVRRILPGEMQATAELYLQGKIDQWDSLQGRPGVVFILNVTDPAMAKEMLEALPLGREHLMSFELVPLGPLTPLRQLLPAHPQ